MKKPYGTNFSEDIKINKLKLDEETVKNPDLRRIYGEDLADSKTERDKAKNLLSATRAQKSLHYRINPKNDVKATDKSVDDMIESDPEIIELNKNLTEANSRMYYLENAVEAIEDRRSQLKNLTALWIGGYFTIGSGDFKKNISENEREEAQDEIRNNLNHRGE